jgi:hypothetical protein
MIGTEEMFLLPVQKFAWPEIERQPNMRTGILIGKYLVAPALQ